MASRVAEMIALFRDGWTHQQIGDKFGVTRQRVQQLLKGRIDRSEGGVAKRSADRDADRREKRDISYIARYGCTFDQWKGVPPQARRAFTRQRENARQRGIKWELSFWKWWTFWQDSGHWHERGRGQGYVMCRHGDSGPYAIGNIFIATARENTSISKNKKYNLPMGVVWVKTTGRYAARRCFNGEETFLGVFDTPELAHQAYLAHALDQAP